MKLAVIYLTILNVFPLPFSKYHSFYIVAILLVIVFFLLGYILGSKAKLPYYISGEKQKKLAERIRRRESKKENTDKSGNSNHNTNTTIISVDNQARNNTTSNLDNHPNGRTDYRQFNPYGRYNNSGYNNRS